MRNRKNAENRGRYRGRRFSITGEQAAVIALLAVAAVLLFTMHTYAVQTGVSIGEQLYEALFVAQDWD